MQMQYEVGKSFTCPAGDITVRGGLDRYRKSMTKLKDLAYSIQEKGQIQPIVVTKDNELIAGGRRLAACAMANIPVLCIYSDAFSDVELRELELEENIQREDFTPADYAIAVRALHELKQVKHGTAKSGAVDGWGLQDTADIIGKTHASVIDELNVADLLDQFPELKQCKTKSEIKKAGRAMNKVVDNALNLTKHKKQIEGNENVILSNTDALSFLTNLPNNHIDILLTDPPYGIEIDKISTGIGGKTGGKFNGAGYTFNDSQENALQLYQTIAQESFRVAKQTAVAYVFTCPEFFNTVRMFFTDAGWECYIKPLIWAKDGGGGQTNIPERWPASSYEMILYARKPDAKLREFRTDVLRFSLVLPSIKRHPTEKPVDLLLDLIHRANVPGDLLLDPCCGSGSSLVAAIKANLIAVGNDISLEAYVSASAYVVETMK